MPEMTRYQMRMSEREKEYLYKLVKQSGYKDITDLLLSLVQQQHPDFPREPRKEGRPTKKS